MNSYFSRAEKETFVRLTSLAGLQEQIIAGYAGGNNADKEFLKLLRTSKTWLMKALDYRTSFLDESAALDLARQVTKLDLIFVPNDKARKEYELLKEVQTHVHMPMDDFETWYCEVIEHTCKVCTREDYKTCAARRVMAKHGVYPMNPAAINTCQFSYVGADPAELPPPRPPREVAQDVVDEQEEADSLPVESELVVVEEVAAAANIESAQEDALEASERIAPLTVPVEIYLCSGARLEMELPTYMAERLFSGMKSLPKSNRPICACHVGEALVAIDTQEVAVFRATGIGECELTKGTSGSGNQNALPSKNMPEGNMNAVQRSIETAAFKVECKCGAEYVCRLGADRDKARCQKCHASVYRDDTVLEPLTVGGEATLMTNRYFVPREEGQSDRRAPVRESEGKKTTPKSYEDPCKVFDAGGVS